MLTNLFFLAKPVNVNIVKIEAFKCEDTENFLLRSEVNQVEETTHPLPTNSFHFTRTNDTFSVNGSDCYRWNFIFERPVEAAFLVIDINMGTQVVGKNDTLTVNVSITNR